MLKLTHYQTVRALEQLFKAELIGGFMVDQTPAPVIIRATTKGLQQTSGWPREGGGSELRFPFIRWGPK